MENPFEKPFTSEELEGAVEGPITNESEIYKKRMEEKGKESAEALISKSRALEEARQKVRAAAVDSEKKQEFIKTLENEMAAGLEDDNVSAEQFKSTLSEELDKFLSREENL